VSLSALHTPIGRTNRYNAGVAITFYCTRCGTRMELDAAQAGQSVRCVHCAGLVRTPDGPVGAPDLPPLAALAAALPVMASGGRVLSYLPAWPWRHAHELHVVEMARRLNELANSGNDAASADFDGAETMTNCSYCGSTIAGFLRKCPYCRHALWGV
jgi:hypothetical protein